MTDAEKELRKIATNPFMDSEKVKWIVFKNLPPLLAELDRLRQENARLKMICDRMDKAIIQAIGEE